MWMSKTRRLVEEQIHALPPEVRLVIVQPEFQMRYLAFESLVGDGAIYVSFRRSKLTLEDIRAQVDPAIAENGASSGKRIRTARIDVILDECDRADGNALRDYVKTVLARPEINRVYLFTRLLPQPLLTDSRLREQMRVLPQWEPMMLWDYLSRENGSALLEVRAFGRGRVQLDGRNVTDWDGSLPRMLFFYLIDRGMSTRGDIFKTFWPSLTTAEATNVFHVTKRKVTEVLGVGLTQFGSGFYHLSPDLQVSYDVALFNHYYNLSQISPSDESIDLLEYGISLYRGNFLAGVDLPWVVERRSALKAMFNDMLVLLARRYHEMGERKKAYGAYLRAAAHNPMREDLVQSILSLSRELKTYQDGDIVYDRLRQTLRRSMNIDPSPQTRILYDGLRRE